MLKLVLVELVSEMMVGMVFDGRILDVITSLVILEVVVLGNGSTDRDRQNDGLLKLL